MKLSRLRVLSLGRVEAGGRAALPAVTGMRQLEELRLYGEGVDGNTLPALAALPRLERLDVQFLKMSAATARAVKAACPPWVECVAPAEEG